MSAEYPHLHDSARAYACESNEARIRRIRSERWITYARAEGALLQLDDLLTFPKRTRMPNLLLVGPTNNGKTMILERFRRSHPPTAASATEHGAANVPVLTVQMPAAPDESRFFVARHGSGAVVRGTPVRMVRAEATSLACTNRLAATLTAPRQGLSESKNQD
jgi:hypothetical protein